MFFTMCLGYRDKSVKSFCAVCSGTIHVRAVGVALAGKNPWPQLEGDPFCLAHWSEGQTLAPHNQPFQDMSAEPGSKERQQDHSQAKQCWSDSSRTAAGISWARGTVLRWPVSPFPSPQHPGSGSNPALTPTEASGWREEAASSSTDHTHTDTHMPPQLLKGRRTDTSKDSRTRTEQHNYSILVK